MLLSPHFDSSTAIILEVSKSHEYMDTMHRANYQCGGISGEKSSDNEHSSPVQADPGTVDKMEIKSETNLGRHG